MSDNSRNTINSENKVNVLVNMDVKISFESFTLTECHFSYVNFSLHKKLKICVLSYILEQKVHNLSTLMTDFKSIFISLCDTSYIPKFITMTYM